MITKRTGNGQTECTRCKKLGKFALNWDSALYTFNKKPYCFECLLEMLEEKDEIIKDALNYIEKNNFMDTWRGSCIYGEVLLTDILEGDNNEK